MTSWLSWLGDTATKEPSALVSILACEGSVPRGPGTRMLVTQGTLLGTIGGGQLEFRAVEQARAILDHPPGTWRVQDYPLGPLLGQCCGGRVRLLIEHVDAAELGWISAADDKPTLVTALLPGRIERHFSDEASLARISARGERPREGDRLVEPIDRRDRPVYLFGAGHVGQAIARHADFLPLRLAWFDVRPMFDAIDGVTIVPDDAIEQCIAGAPDDAAILILTHDHALDYRLTKAALERPPVPYVGLIGSATKRARFLSRLEKDGIDANVVARLTSPIGVPEIRGKEPDVIAIATIAQLLQLGRA